MRFAVREFTLDGESIPAIRDGCVADFRKTAGKRCDDTHAEKLALTLEEILLRFLTVYGTGTKCRITGTKSMGSIRFDAAAFGDPKNPLDVTGEASDLSLRILQHFAQVPVYTYNTRDHANIVSFEAKQLPVRNKMLRQILGALVLAVLTAFGFRLLPEATAALLREAVVEPVFLKLTAVITAVATPLVFFGVISGITGIGSSSAVGSMGKRLLRNMGITYGISAVVFSLFAALMYPTGGLTAGESGSVLKDIVQLVLDIVPSNLGECFISDNDLQVIVIAVFVGVVLLSLGERAARVDQAVTLLGDVVNKMMALVCKLLPLIVYLGILNMMLSDTSGIYQMYRVALALIASSLVIVAYLLLRTRFVARVSLKALFRKQLPTLMINLTTSSQVAALPENMRCCKDELGIDERFVNFALPLSIVAYMPAGAAFLGLTVWGVASLSGITFGMAELFKVAVVSVVVAIAAPPIPGSAFAVMPILFTSCGVPMTYYSVAIICGTVLGYFLPAVNGFCMQLELLIAGTELDLVEREKHCSERKKKE